MKKSNADRFIAAFNDIDYSLRTIYDFKRSTSFSDIVRRSVVLNSVVRKYEEDLIDFGRLRNAIIHNGNSKYTIAEPHTEIVEKIEKLAGKRESLANQKPSMPGSGFTPGGFGGGMGGFAPSGGGFSSQMNPLAARFASLAAAQKRNNSTSDDDK